MNLLVFNLRMNAEDGVLGFTTDWVNALARRCDSVTVITMDAGVIRVEPNVTVFSVGQERGYGKIRRGLNFYGLLWKVLRTRRIDACFTHMNFLFALMAAPLLKLFRVPILLWYAHGAVPPSLKLTERLVDRIVTSSPTGFRLPSAKLKVIGQGIDTERFTPLPLAPETGGPLELLAFGRVSRIKRIEVVIDALAHIRDVTPGPALHCSIVGDPLSADCRAYLAELQARVRTLGLEEQVTFRPGIPFDRAYEAFQAADMVINSSDTDSVDKTVLEALCCGVPVITSNAAFKDVLPAGMQPFAMVPKNDVPALAAAIVAMAGWTAAERRAFALEGRRLIVAEHSLDALAGKLMVELDALVGARRPRSSPTSAGKA